MNDSSTYIKWFYRALLIGLSLPMTYVVTRTGYNFAHWVPHRLIRSLGVSYEHMLWAEQNADMALHFFGAALLVVLIFKAKLAIISVTPTRSLIAVVVLCVGAEMAQFAIGRGVESSDLLLGILGGFMAYLAIDKNKPSST